MNLRFFMVVLLGCASLSGRAGEKDLDIARKKAESYSRRASDFLYLRDQERKKQRDPEPLRQLLSQRQKAAQLREKNRREYVAKKKQIRRTGDRGFARDVAEKQAFDHQRRRELGDYIQGIENIRRAVKEYRQQVDEMEEVRLPSDYE